MRILLSNDDGIHAPGLAVLEEIARALSDDVTVVAPIEEQSGTGRSLTLTRPVRLQNFGEKRWAVTGTPTDAVMMALTEVMKDAPPDLMLSGVNRGGNLGEDVFYSGTVAAAMEAALAGIPAIALSQRYAEAGRGDAVSFAAARGWGARVLAPLVARDWPARTVLNVNFPALDAEAVKGVRAVSQGLRAYGRARFERRTDPRGYDYYWLAMGRIPHTPDAATDLEAVEQGYVAVTPLQLDLTHGTTLAGLEALFA